MESSTSPTESAAPTEGQEAAPKPTEDQGQAAPPAEAAPAEAAPAEAAPAEAAPAQAAEATPAEPTPLLTTPDLPARAFPPKVLSDLMIRKVITVREDEAIGDLETWMTRFSFHHLPVVNAEMKLTGLITRTDLLHGLLGVGPDGKSIEKAGPETHAGVIMRRNVVTGTPDTSLAMACGVMLKEKLGCLPIVLENGTLVGIVTQTDLVRLVVDLFEYKG